MHSTMKVAIFGFSCVNLVSSIRRHTGAVGLEERLEKDWQSWAESEAAKANKKLGFEETPYEEYDRLSLAEVNGSSAMKPSPCYSPTPCINGKRGWWHTCKEEISAGDKSLWQNVINQVDCVPVAITAGNVSGPFFVYENYGRTMSQVFGTFSGGKRPGAAAVARSVAVGNMTWDTKASEVFDWWTNDTADTRSRVKLADLLHFTSGFLSSGMMDFDHDRTKHECLNSRQGPYYTLEDCAKQIYENTHHVEPNTVSQYNSLHTQIAFAMAVKRSGMSPQEYLKENLFEPAGMTNTYFGGEGNPFIAGGMMTTGYDYAGFMRAYLGDTYLPKHVTTVMETEYRNSHKINDIGSAVRMPDWGMCQFHLEGFPECWSMGGSQQNCINRAAGTYWMLMPRVKEYYGRALGGGAIISAKVLMYARFWVHDPLNKALAPLAKISAKTTTSTTTNVFDEESIKQQFDVEETEAQEMEEANGIEEPE